MSFLTDLFSNNAAQQASEAYNNQLLAAWSGYQGDINSGNQALTSNYTAALQPFLQNQQVANAGTKQLGNVLGLNGAAGNQSALSTLQSTPGYQFQLQQGDNAVNAAAAANGTLNSGNQALALGQYNQGLAGTTYNNYVSQLQPYLNYSTANAAGGGAVQTGLGSALNQNYNNLGNTNLQVGSAIGSSIAGAEMNANSGISNLLSLFGGAGGLLGGSGILGGLGSTLGSLFTGATGSLGTGSEIGDLMATFGL